MHVWRAFVVAAAMFAIGCTNNGGSCKSVTKTIDNVAALRGVDLEGHDFDALAKRTREAADRADKVASELSAITVRDAELARDVSDYRAMASDAAKALRAFADRADDIAKALARLAPIANSLKTVASAPSDAFDTKKDGHGVGFARGVLTIGAVKHDADDVAAFARELAKVPPKDATVRADLARVAEETKTVDDVVAALSTLVLLVQAAWTAADDAVAKEPAVRARIDAACAR